VTLARRLMLFALAAAVLPLVGVAFAVLSRSEQALATRVAEAQAASARATAEGIARDLDAAQDQLGRVVEAWDPSRLDERELRGFLAMLTSQVGGASASATVDAAGRVQVHGASADADPLLGQFVESVAAAQRDGSWQGTALAFFGGRGGVALAALREVKPPRGGRWVVAVRLDPVLAVRRLAEAGREGRAAWLLDGEGRVLVGSPGAVVLAPADREEMQRLAGSGGASGMLAGPAGAAMAGLAGVPGLAGWNVLVRLPAAEAFKDLLSLRRAVIGTSLAVLAVALAAALLLAGGITRRLAAVEGAARAFGAGDASARVPAGGADELTRVGGAFNVMADELQASRARLERWNEDLKTEVDQRTRELREAQARLVEAQKLAAVGQLGAGVAHEINNPLTGILGNAQLLLEQRDLPAGQREALEAIERMARRCREITRKLLRFSEQRAVPDLRDLELNKAVEDGLALVEGQVRQAGLTLETSLATPSPLARADMAQLTQVVFNLVVNARTACLGKPGARIRVETRQAGPHGEIVVEDQGKGIPAEHLPRLFEPFFTTKDLWSNVGLGLSEAWRIVDEHGGDIQVRSEPGQGSTFTVRLPLATGRTV